MGLLDKIKNSFNRTNNQTNTPSEIQGNLNDKSKVPITLNRIDGSSITISPRLDRLGNQIYRYSKNKETGEVKYIPEFSIIADELLNARLTHGSTMTNICIDIDPKLLEDETYTYFIADVLLASEKIPEIIDQNEGYAGGLKLGELGQVLGCYSDEQVIQGLKNARDERHKQHQAEKEQQGNGVVVSPNKPKPHGTKSDDVQVLDPSKLDAYKNVKGR